MDIIKVKSEIEIYNLLSKYNDRYVKPLSQKEINELSQKFWSYAVLYKAVEDNITLGYIAFYNNDLARKEAFISQICVDKNATNRGIGKELINRCFEECKKENMRTVKLRVYSSNEAAINLYKKMGFSVKYEDREFGYTYMDKDI